MRFEFGTIKYYEVRYGASSTKVRENHCIKFFYFLQKNSKKTFKVETRINLSKERNLKEAWKISFQLSVLFDDSILILDIDLYSETQEFSSNIEIPKLELEFRNFSIFDFFRARFDQTELNNHSNTIIQSSVWLTRKNIEILKK